MKTISIIAPNIKEGGGKGLLLYLLNHLDENYPNVFVRVYVDKSFKVINTNNREVITLSSWLKIILLFLKKCNNVIYFGNIPPMRKTSNSLLYFHSMYLLAEIKKLTSNMTLKRLFILKILLQQFYIKHNISNVVLVASQTKSVTKILKNRYNYYSVKELPFYKPLIIESGVTKEYDFCYISNVYPHKNHTKLLDALEILSNENISLSIVLTIDKKNVDILKRIEKINSKGFVSLYNIGHVNMDVVIKTYAKSKCLVYPSIIESFGLPLIEAVEAGIDVIASDLPYVFEVIKPSLTFDPNNPKDIAQKMNMYLNHETPRSIKIVENKISELIEILL